MSLSVDEMKRILKEMDLKEDEIEAYFFILKEKEFDVNSLIKNLNIDEKRAKEIIELFIKKGLIISSTKNERFKCLHPRMGLTNIYKMWEEAQMIEMRRKRAKIELLVRNLTPIYEQ
jgi:predicted transcriptional regulator